MSTTIYRPRMQAYLTVPTMGSAADKRRQAASSESFRFPIRIRRMWLESNDHNRADQCKVVAEWRDTGSDPRYLSNAVLELYVGNADDFGNWQPTRDDLRFVGIATRTQRIGKEDEGFRVEFEFLDYTTIFLEAKPFGSKGVPDLSMTLEQAWRTIVSQTPGAEALADRLVFKGGAHGGMAIGKGVAERFRKLSKVPVRPNTDAWAVWQQCVGMLGLISYIRGDECIVTTDTGYYTSGDPPKLVWGRNILNMIEARNQIRAGKGIGITSYDPLTGAALEALWPPVGDSLVIRKSLSAKKAGDQAAVRQAEDREYFAVPSVTSPTELLDIAKRVYEERSRQELEGTLITREMKVSTMSGAEFDVLKLAAGDTVRVEFEQQDREALAGIPTLDARVQYLVDRGYSEDIAKIMAANVSDITQLSPYMHVKRVTTTFEVEGDDGDFNVEVSYCNKILVDGSAQDAAAG